MTAAFCVRPSDVCSQKTVQSGPKTNFLPQLPVAGDMIKFTGQILFFFGHETLFAKTGSHITTTMTKHIYNVFNLSFTLLPRKKLIYWFIFFLFVPKNFEILVLYMFSANGAGHRVTPVSQLQCVCGVYFFRTHVNRLEQGYSISFIWGLDYQTEHLKGAKGVGAVLIFFWGTYEIRN